MDNRSAAVLVVWHVTAIVVAAVRIWSRPRVAAARSDAA
jgi:hypothetical protein